MSIKPDPLAYPPRGLNREEAARYIGISPSLFDEMVADRRMPRGKRINSRVVWDRTSLDIAFTALPGDENTIDALLTASAKVVAQRGRR